MSNKYILNDGFKLEVIKMLDTVPFKELLGVVKARTPDYASSSSDVHVVAAQAKLREGYEMAINNMLNIAHEEPVQPVVDPERILLSPED